MREYFIASQPVGGPFYNYIDFFQGVSESGIWMLSGGDMVFQADSGSLGEYTIVGKGNVKATFDKTGDAVTFDAGSGGMYINSNSGVTANGGIYNFTANSNVSYPNYLTGINASGTNLYIGSYPGASTSSAAYSEYMSTGLGDLALTGRADWYFADINDTLRGANYLWDYRAGLSNVYVRFTPPVDTPTAPINVAAPNESGTIALVSNLPVLDTLTYTTTGIALQTDYVITHGLGYTPKIVIPVAMTLGSSGVYYTTWDATTVTIHFAVSPGVVAIKYKLLALK